MLDILSITGVIFVLIGTGYAVVRVGIFSPAEISTLGKFVVTIALPTLIFRAVSTRSLEEIVNTGYLAAVLGGSLAVFALGYFWVRHISAASPLASTFAAMGMSCANSGFIGYPVLLMALPSVASTALALNMIVENLIMIPLVLVLAERARSTTVSRGRLAAAITSRLARNPIVLALVLGTLVSLSGVALPVVVERPVDILAGASAPLSLVAIGGTLAGLKIRSFDLSVASVVMGKLIVHPLAVGLGLIVMSAIGMGVKDDRLASAAVIMASTPAMAIYPILAQRFGEERLAALAMFAMTVLSFFTMSAVLAIMSH